MYMKTHRKMLLKGEADEVITSTSTGTSACMSRSTSMSKRRLRSTRTGTVVRAD